MTSQNTGRCWKNCQAGHSILNASDLARKRLLLSIFIFYILTDSRLTSGRAQNISLSVLGSWHWNMQSGESAIWLNPSWHHLLKFKLPSFSAFVRVTAICSITPRLLMMDGPAGWAQGTGQRWAHSGAQGPPVWTTDNSSWLSCPHIPEVLNYGVGKEPFSTSLTTFIGAASLSHLDQSRGGGVKGRDM